MITRVVIVTASGLVLVSVLFVIACFARYDEKPTPPPFEPLRAWVPSDCEPIDP